MTTSTLRLAMVRASEGRTKQIAVEAFPSMTFEAAQAELSKYLTGERGESAFRVVAAVMKFGDRAVLRSYFDEKLREFDPSQIAERISQLGEQLDWIKD